MLHMPDMTFSNGEPLLPVSQRLIYSMLISEIKLKGDLLYKLGLSIMYGSVNNISAFLGKPRKQCLKLTHSVSFRNKKSLFTVGSVDNIIIGPEPKIPYSQGVN